MSTQLFIPITKNARVITRITPGASQLLIALHGYGQLASYFSKAFENLPETCDFLIPEGMHRFYLEGSSGRVGASWMTKEEREMDIADNLNYLNQLLNTHLKEHSYDEIHVLGFSQGGATAARWVGQLKMSINKLILWACVFPDDMQHTFEAGQCPVKERIFVLGDEDPYFTGEQGDQATSYYRKLDFSLILYPGTHRVQPEVLQQIIQQS